MTEKIHGPTAQTLDYDLLLQTAEIWNGHASGPELPLSGGLVQEIRGCTDASAQRHFWSSFLMLYRAYYATKWVEPVWGQRYGIRESDLTSLSIALRARVMGLGAAYLTNVEGGKSVPPHQAFAQDSLHAYFGYASFLVHHAAAANDPTEMEMHVQLAAAFAGHPEAQADRERLPSLDSEAHEALERTQHFKVPVDEARRFAETGDIDGMSERLEAANNFARIKGIIINPPEEAQIEAIRYEGFKNASLNALARAGTYAAVGDVQRTEWVLEKAHSFAQNAGADYKYDLKAEAAIQRTGVRNAVRLKPLSALRKLQEALALESRHNEAFLKDFLAELDQLEAAAREARVPLDRENLSALRQTACGLTVNAILDRAEYYAITRGDVHGAVDIIADARQLAAGTGISFNEDRAETILLRGRAKYLGGILDGANDDAKKGDVAETLKKLEAARKFAQERKLSPGILDSTSFESRLRFHQIRQDAYENGVRAAIKRARGYSRTQWRLDIDYVDMMEKELALAREYARAANPHIRINVAEIHRIETAGYRRAYQSVLNFARVLANDQNPGEDRTGKIEKLLAEANRYGKKIGVVPDPHAVSEIHRAGLTNTASFQLKRARASAREANLMNMEAALQKADLYTQMASNKPLEQDTVREVRQSYHRVRTEKLLAQAQLHADEGLADLANAALREARLAALEGGTTIPAETVKEIREAVKRTTDAPKVKRNMSDDDRLRTLFLRAKRTQGPEDIEVFLREAAPRLERSSDDLSAIAEVLKHEALRHRLGGLEGALKSVGATPQNIWSLLEIRDEEGVLAGREEEFRRKPADTAKRARGR